MIVGVAGVSSSIAEAFVKGLPRGIKWRREPLAELQPGLERYLICTGYLAGRSLGEMTYEESVLTWRRNFVEVARFCDLAFVANPKCRICVIGSESAYSGSYDIAYAGAKAALHLYVETKKLNYPEQQLVAIAPTVILDSGMTQRRKDLNAVEARFAVTRHGRPLQAAEVAALAHVALFSATAFLSNTVLRCGVGA
jgi:NAD(P)-dependent dehydrogenase (short-subunit alcohol dehydrogenase family)